MTHGYSLRWLTFTFLSTLFWFALDPPALRAQPIIVNEVYNSNGSTGGDERVELLVVKDSLDIRGWDLRDFTSGSPPVAQPPLVFTSNSLWSLLSKGTIIVIDSPLASSPFTEDTDPSDRLL